jgi:hypothetical protein
MKQETLKQWRGMQKNIYPKPYRLEQARGNLSMFVADHGRFNLTQLPRVRAELGLAALHLRCNLPQRVGSVHGRNRVCRLAGSATQLTCKTGSACMRVIVASSSCCS